MSKRPITTPLLSLYLVLLSFAAMLGFSNLAQAEAADRDKPCLLYTSRCV